MPGDRYKISDQYATYFSTLTIIKWIDLFSRRNYRDILVDSLNYCHKNKGLEVFSYVIMSNHMHLIARTHPPFKFSDFLRDYKKFTSKAIMKEMDLINESRREWLVDKFEFEARKTGRAENCKIWKDSNHAIEIDGKVSLWQKINYIHDNPVRAGLVAEPEHYIYSSARDYTGKKGVLTVSVV